MSERKYPDGTPISIVGVLERLADGDVVDALRVSGPMSVDVETATSQLRAVGGKVSVPRDDREYLWRTRVLSTDPWRIEVVLDLDGASSDAAIAVEFVYTFNEMLRSWRPSLVGIRGCARWAPDQEQIRDADRSTRPIFEHFEPRRSPDWEPYPDPLLSDRVWEILDALVERDEVRLRAAAQLRSWISIEELFAILAGYGASFVMPPDRQTFDLCSSLVVEGNDVSIDLYLYSEEELRSDLSLTLTCERSQSTGEWICVIEDLLVR